MAERLTEKDKYGNNAIFQKKDKFTIAKDKNNDIRVYGKAIDKLAQLEDIMDKYGVESVEELSKIFSYLSGRFINSVYSLKHKFDSYEDKIKYLANKKGQYYEELYETKQDRDTWKRACELMGEELDMYATKEDNTISTAQYFHQQAKTEGENK